MQLNAMLLLIFMIITPIAIPCFSSNGPFAIGASVVVVGAFSSLWMLANDLEDPFGQDANDMPMVEYHEEFCRSLQEALCQPWTSKDTWLPAEEEAASSASQKPPHRTTQRRKSRMGVQGGSAGLAEQDMEEADADGGE